MFTHLPLFLDEDDYNHIDSILNPDSIHQAFVNGYKLLQSPAGFAIKKIFLRDPLGFTFMALKKLKTLQVSDKFEIVDGFIMTKDRKNLLLFIVPQNPSTETIQNQKLLNGIDIVISKINRNFNNKVYGETLGTIVYATSNAKRIKKDIFLSIIVAFVLISSLIGWYFKSWKIPLMSLLPAIFGGALALAILYLIKGQISTIALGIGSVLLGLIVDYALYLINQFRKKGDIIVVLKDLSFSILLCSITTAGAFLGMLFLQSSVLRDLGLFASFSVFGAAIFSLIILPHIIEHIEQDNTVSRPNLIDRIASIQFEKSLFFVVLLFSSLLVAMFFVSRVDFETDMHSLNYIPNKLKSTEQKFDRIADASLSTIYIVAMGENLNDALKINEKNITKLRELESNGLVQTMSGCNLLLFSDSLQQVKIQRWKLFWNEKRNAILKTNMEAASKVFKFKNGVFDDFLKLPGKQYNLLNPDEIKDIKTQFLSDFINESNGSVMISTLLKVENENREKVFKSLEKSTDLVYFDKQLITKIFVENVHSDFELLVKFSMVFVTFLLLLAFGRIEIGIITALPMFASWLLSLGFMGFTSIRFNIFNIIVSSFIFGLGVDYSILMMRGILSNYKTGIQDTTTYKTSIILSSLTTLIGIGALFFAVHPALRSIAGISVFGVFAVVIISFTVQPLLSNWFLSNRLLTKQHPITFWIFLRTFITWGNIVLVAILQVLFGGIIFILFPLSNKKKRFLFHWLFSKLCKLYISTTFPTNSKIFNPYKENFHRPAVIISNHQSLIDTPFFLQLYPKILILTNNWVWHSPVFGPVARMASYYNAEDGIDGILQMLSDKVKEGYSILVFPEAHRYNDNQIHRFHKGAFYLAEKLQIDILPIVIFGTGEFLRSGQFFGRPSGIRMKILERYAPLKVSNESDYLESSKQFRRLYTREYEELMAKEGIGRYYRKKLLLTYVFKSPVIEWYLRVKMVLEGYYQSYNELIPRNGEILDLGCGYGFLCYMLSFTSPNRKIIGVDYDPDKIQVALKGYSRSENMNFICEDLTRYSFESKDAIILGDVLHYLAKEDQKNLLDKCIKNLRPGGMIIIREADSDSTKLHGRTKLTELFSTKILGFNKTMDDQKSLHFTTIEELRKVAESHHLQLEVISSSQHTSNALLIIRRSS